MPSLPGSVLLNKTSNRVAVRVLRTSTIAWIDLVLLSVCVAITTLRFYDAPVATDLRAFLTLRVSMRNVIITIVCLVLWSLLLRLSGLYSSRSFRHQARCIPVAVTLCTAVSAFAFSERSTGGGLLMPVMMFLGLSLVAFYTTRVIIRFSADYLSGQVRATRLAIIIGSGSLAQRLAETLKLDTHVNYVVLGFFDTLPQAAAADLLGPHLGTLDELEDFLLNKPVDDVLIALPQGSFYQEIQRTLEICERAGIQSHLLANPYATSVTKKVTATEGRLVLRMVHHDGRRFIKRLFDMAGALLGIIFLSPLLVLVALAVKFTSPGGIIFQQKRFGLNRRLFTMYKFRSMVSDAEVQQASLEHLNETSGPVFKINKDPRVTTVGSFIRKTSLDELPQLFNVLKGDMSLVGPRPLPIRDVNRVSELSTMRRFSMKPGMTGLWQVSGRSSLDFSGWMKLDLRYIDNWSLKMDFRILARTIPAVMKGRGAA